MDASTQTLYQVLGGREPIMALAHAFYDAMERDEPALAALHERDAAGQVTQDSRERFGLFLVGWLGGPQEYMATYGHPRLRMRHARVRVDTAMRDAWLRAMDTAMREQGVPRQAHAYLNERFSQVADFMRNTPDEAVSGS